MSTRIKEATDGTTNWPVDGLEYMGHCPVCGSTSRERFYEGLNDHVFDAPGNWTMFKCGGCGSGYLDPRPTRETIGLAYKNYFTHEPDPLPTGGSFWKRSRVAIRNAYLNRKFGYKFTPAVPWGFWVMHLLPSPLRLEWDHLARHLRPPQPGHNRLLDVGCGNGAFLSRARQAGWKAFGTDFDPNAGKVAKAEGAEIWIGDFRDAPFVEGSFDVVTSDQVIEHVHEPKDFLAHIYKWLKPGGRLWLGTPSFQCRIHDHFGSSYANLHPPQHLTVFSNEAIINLIKDAGFSEPRVLRRGFFEYAETMGSIAISRGKRREEFFTYRAHATAFEKGLGFWYELLAWLRPVGASDLVIVATKSAR
ncbi:MAG TPA: class I SAM-dependent methyltransferase [Gammaproteobacteria bacterium]|nr:class I SAM-dependent methyltransferase [Gammaproteobacteria bacterium]